MAQFMYPSYLSDPSYKYRNMKIYILENAITSTDAGSVFNTLISKSDELSQLTSAAESSIAGAVVGAASGAVKGAMTNIGKAASKTQQILDRGASVLHTIILPLPNGFSDSHSHQWSADKGILGSVGAAIEQAVGKGIAVAADMANIRKPLVDPGYFQNYSGTDPRSWSFSFDLIPQNANDAAQIYAIIKYLRGYSLPSTSVNNALILAPHYFRIEFTNSIINDLMGAHDVVLKEISVNYSEDGNMQQTADGMPKHIKLELSFAERSMSTYETYMGIK